MKKRVYGRKLSRGRSARMALRRSLIRALVTSGRITTTKAKAKFVIRDVEKLVRNSIEADVATRRRIYSFLANDKNVSDRLYEIANKFGSRSSGFTKLTLLPRRRGDNAEMARLEWSEKIDYSEVDRSEKKAKSTQAKSVKKEVKKDKKAQKVEKKEKVKK